MTTRSLILFLLGLGICHRSFAQDFLHGRDTMVFGVPVPIFLLQDSLSRKMDTMAFQDRLQKEQKGGQKKMPVTGKPNTSNRAPFVQFTGGYAGYNFNYRSALDTPYAEKNITQQQVLSTLNFTLAGMVPIRVNSYIRRSNSAFFRNITDVQVTFDAAAYRSRLAVLLKNRLLQQAPAPDSLTGRLYDLRKGQAKHLGNWLQDPLTKQKLIEANEVLRVPHLSYNMQLPDSVNKYREDSLRKEAGLLLDLYTRTQKTFDRLNGERDSLKNIYDGSVDKLRQFRKLSGPSFNNRNSYEQWKGQLQQYAPPGAGEISPGQQWLLGVRSLGLGRNNINTSELTAKNLSLNGVHFEYNSWYFLGLSAGLVDYRFRDFVVHRLREPRQYMYMVRAGLGRLEKDYFILSVFGGQKQLLTSVNNAGQSPTIRMTGLSAETKWQVDRNTYLVAEAAQSFSPVLPGSESVGKGGWDLSDRSNKALSLKFSSFIPATSSRLEAQYKFTGANYQSFNSFQANSQLKAWYVKGEQNFFHRQLKLTASLRSNDFSNPYIVQHYSANTVFKSLSISFHKKGLPILMVGYMPMSQLTKVGDQLEESKFQTINTSISHFYRLGLRQAATNIVYTKFFNSNADSGFIYYNSVNLYASQTIFFRDFTTTLALSHSRNTGYQYNVLEGNISVPVTEVVSFGMGAKLHELNGRATGAGGFVDANIAISPRDRLSMHLEKGYLPGSGAAAKLVENVLGTISYMKIFK